MINLKTLTLIGQVRQALTDMFIPHERHLWPDHHQHGIYLYLVVSPWSQSKNDFKWKYRFKKIEGLCRTKYVCHVALRELHFKVIVWAGKGFSEKPCSKIQNIFYNESIFFLIVMIHKLWITSHFVCRWEFSAISRKFRWRPLGRCKTLTSMRFLNQAK